WRMNHTGVCSACSPRQVRMKADRSCCPGAAGLPVIDGESTTALRPGRSIRPGRSGAYLVLAVSSLSLGRADETQCRRAPPLGTGRNGFTESCSLSGNEQSFVTVDPG